MTFSSLPYVEAAEEEDTDDTTFKHRTVSIQGESSSRQHVNLNLYSFIPNDNDEESR